MSGQTHDEPRAGHLLDVEHAAYCALDAALDVRRAVESALDPFKDGRGYADLEVAGGVPERKLRERVIRSAIDHLGRLLS